MVTRPLRQATGAHYGWKDWLAQRVSAIVMALYTLLLIAIGIWNGGFQYPFWRALFTSNFFRLATFVAVLALIWHAWIGVRDILMDYVKPVGTRLALEVATIVVLFAYVGWTIQILWGVR